MRRDRGQPQDPGRTVETLRTLIGKTPVVRVGHQLLALAFGAQT
jgi:carbamoylphosphate synthase small subunit